MLRVAVTLESRVALSARDGTWFVHTANPRLAIAAVEETMTIAVALLLSVLNSVPSNHVAALPLCTADEVRCDGDGEASLDPINRAVDPALSNPHIDWPQFSHSAIRSRISSANVARLELKWRVDFAETAEGSPAFLSGVTVQGVQHDLVIISTVNGRLIAFDAQTAEVVWSTAALPGPRWSTSSPAVDPNGLYVYVYALDGYVHRHDVQTGTEITGDGWPELVTLKGDVEKVSSALTVATDRDGESYLYVTTAGYPDPGDAGDYQGHLVTIRLRTGRQQIFNAACSDNAIHFLENGGPTTDCTNVQSGIWARAGAVFDAATNRVFVTTGNGVYDADQGGFDWGTSVVALRPDGSLDGGEPLDSWTPAEFQELTDQDLDLSSTTIAPLILPDGSPLPALGVQGGKDGKLRLLDLSNLSGLSGPRHIGGELQVLGIPQGGQILTRPAVWLAGRTSYVAVATDDVVSAFALDVSDSRPRLVPVWTAAVPSTSPVYANGLLFCAHSGGLRVLDAETGRELWIDSSVAPIHWQTPIVVGTTVFLCDSAGLSAYQLRSRGQ